MISLPLTSIVLRDDGRWQFNWTTTGAPSYRVVLFGNLVNSTIAPPYVYPLPGWEKFPPFIEVVPFGQIAQSEIFLPSLVLQWYRVPGAKVYCIQEFVAGVWTTRDYVSETGLWAYNWTSAILSDETVHQFQILSMDLLGQTSAPLSFQVHTVKNPVLDPTTIKVTYTKPNVVIASS